MINLTLLLICLLAGVLLRQIGAVPPDAHLTLNQLLVRVFIPALTLLYGPEMPLARQFWLPVLSPWIVFLAGLAFFGWIARPTAAQGLHVDRATLGTLQLTGGISSISFVGFPIFELLYGPAGLAVGLVMSQAGTFLVAMTLGVAVAGWHSDERPAGWQLWLNMLRFPPFPVFLVALLLNLAGYRHPAVVRSLLERLSSPFSVLALLAVGLQLDVRVRREQWPPLLTGLFYKLLLAPLLIFGVVWVVLDRHDYVARLCILGAAIGPMNTAAVLVTRYRLNSPLAAQMVGLGIPLSLPVVYLIHLILTRYT